MLWKVLVLWTVFCLAGFVGGEDDIDFDFIYWHPGGRKLASVDLNRYKYLRSDYIDDDDAQRNDDSDSVLQPESVESGLDPGLIALMAEYADSDADYSEESTESDLFSGLTAEPTKPDLEPGLSTEPAEPAFTDPDSGLTAESAKPDSGLHPGDVKYSGSQSGDVNDSGLQSGDVKYSGLQAGDVNDSGSGFLQAESDKTDNNPGLRAEAVESDYNSVLRALRAESAYSENRKEKRLNSRKFLRRPNLFLNHYLAHTKLNLYNRQKRVQVIRASQWFEDFDQNKDLVVMVHGTVNDENYVEDFFNTMAYALLKNADYNVIGMDWRYFYMEERDIFDVERNVQDAMRVGHVLQSVVERALTFDDFDDELEISRYVPRTIYIGHGLGNIPVVEQSLTYGYAFDVVYGLTPRTNLGSHSHLALSHLHGRLVNTLSTIRYPYSLAHRNFYPVYNDKFYFKENKNRLDYQILSNAILYGNITARFCASEHDYNQGYCSKLTEIPLWHRGMALDCRECNSLFFVDQLKKSEGPLSGLVAPCIKEYCQKLCPRNKPHLRPPFQEKGPICVITMNKAIPYFETFSNGARDTTSPTESQPNVDDRFSLPDVEKGIKKAVGTAITTLQDNIPEPLKSFLGSTIFANCTVPPVECPNENVTFWYYPRPEVNVPVKISVSDPRTFENIERNDRVWKLIIHGYSKSKDEIPNPELREAYRIQGKGHNILSLDYAPLARELCYFHGVQNVPLISKCTAQMIDELLDRGYMKLENLHIIGFSLGAQVAGQIYKYMRHGRPPRVTALDPAGPEFEGAEDKVVNKNSGDFVDVIHTNTMSFGLKAATGHIDFYLNGGSVQPGCLMRDNRSFTTCSHDRAPQTYAESINSEKGFWGVPCTSGLKFISKLCDTTDENLMIMGEYTPHTARGMYFLQTRSKSPFALGRMTKAYIGI